MYRMILSLLLSLFVLQLLKEGKFDGEIVNDDRERKITGI